MSSESRIEINVDLPLRDLYRATIIIVAYALRYVTGIVILVIALCISSLVYAFLGFPQGVSVGNFGLDLLPFLVTVPVLAVGLFVVPYFRARRMLQAEGMSGRRHYMFSPEGITIESPLANASVKWPAYVQARETRAYFLLYSAPNFANVIPKRCFASDAEINSFRSLLHQEIRKVRLRG